VILVDSSVIFDLTRGTAPRLGESFKTLPEGVCGVVRAEVLHGSRNSANRTALLALLDQFAQIPTPEAVWDAVGDNLAILRTRGLTVPFTDVVLATIAIDGVHELWTHDAHFALIQKWIPSLNLFSESP
jgi:predicted nucleic acid-binding protein